MAARAEFEPATLQTKGTESTNEPQRLTTWVVTGQASLLEAIFPIDNVQSTYSLYS